MSSITRNAIRAGRAISIQRTLHSRRTATLRVDRLRWQWSSPRLKTRAFFQRLLEHGQCRMATERMTTEQLGLLCRNREEVWLDVHANDFHRHCCHRAEGRKACRRFEGKRVLDKCRTLHLPVRRQRRLHRCPRSVQHVACQGIHLIVQVGKQSILDLHQVMWR